MQDWAKYIPGVVGVLAPFVASIAALLPKEAVRWKISFIVAGLLLGFLSFGFNVYSEGVAKETRREIRDQVGAFIDEGTKLQAQMISATFPKPLETVREWEDKVAAYLEAKLGKSYVVRFNNAIGIFAVSQPVHGEFVKPRKNGLPGQSSGGDAVPRPTGPGIGKDHAKSVALGVAIDNAIILGPRPTSERGATEVVTLVETAPGLNERRIFCLAADVGASRAWKILRVLSAVGG